MRFVVGLFVVTVTGPGPHPNDDDVDDADADSYGDDDDHAGLLTLMVVMVGYCMQRNCLGIYACQSELEFAAKVRIVAAAAAWADRPNMQGAMHWRFKSVL